MHDDGEAFGEHREPPPRLARRIEEVLADDLEEIHAVTVRHERRRDLVPQAEPGAKEGQRVEMGNPVIVVESMKMEFSVEAPVSGTVRQLFCKEGSHISAGQMLLIVQEE